MNTDELNTDRKELINWIKNLDNENLLTFLNTLRISEKSKSSDWWDTLTKLEIEDINQGLEDVAKGNTLSAKEFWSKLKS